MLGTQIPDFQNKAASLKAVTTQNSIRGTIIHIDSYGNATTNINHEIFNRIGLERDIEILYGKETERITKIKTLTGSLGKMVKLSQSNSDTHFSPKNVDIWMILFGDTCGNPS